LCSIVLFVSEIWTKSFQSIKIRLFIVNVSREPLLIGDDTSGFCAIPESETRYSPKIFACFRGSQIFFIVNDDGHSHPPWEQPLCTIHQLCLLSNICVKQTQGFHVTPLTPPIKEILRNIIYLLIIRRSNVITKVIYRNNTIAR